MSILGTGNGTFDYYSFTANAGAVGIFDIDAENFDTELFREWFQAFAMNAGITLHVANLYGENNHHIAESCFKGLARALRAAIAIDPRQADRLPSTKGVL